MLGGLVGALLLVYTNERNFTTLVPWLILVGMVLFVILIVSVLSLFGLGDVDRVVPLKNLLAGCLRGVAVAVLIFEGLVNWSYGIPMVLGCLIGGYVGGMVSNRAPRRLLRSLFIVIGFSATAYYFWHVYGTPIVRIGGE